MTVTTATYWLVLGLASGFPVGVLTMTVVERVRARRLRAGEPDDMTALADATREERP